ncbi:tyrosine aminotransferase-like [Mangifera indica]|uniref:tyrosine aminotransferase-like n=1 Tax=Mangifera indica TaxID=29780 RepID=UPI001CFB6587|nr:tyrosine aminotransferase-like [Mangifera indica]
MDNESSQKWGFQVHQKFKTESAITVRAALISLMENIDQNDSRPTIPLGHGDPSVFPSFRTAKVVEDAIIDAVRSTKFNCYGPLFGILPARRAVADYLNRDLPYMLSPDDVYLTLGCKQAITVILSVLLHPGANILLPRPCWPYYEFFTRQNNVEARLFDLLPEKGWEVDLDAVEALADENTVAMVIINPGNPCGNVFTDQHLQKIAETARKLGIMVISDEVYDHLTFGNKAYVRMGVFGSTVPVITLGSISKRWIVPGWRLGWLVTCDPNGILKKSGVVDAIREYINITSDPAATLIQGAVPQILEKTETVFYSKIIDILRVAADICYDRIKEIPCINCPTKPEGSMFVMVKLIPSLLADINDDMEFCHKLAKEESVIVLPGTVLRMKNWLRITFAIEPSALEDGLGRIKAFYHRHAKK